MLTLTLAGVRTVSLVFWPSRALSLRPVSTDTRPHTGGFQAGVVKALTGEDQAVPAALDPLGGIIVSGVGEEISDGLSKPGILNAGKNKAVLPRARIGPGIGRPIKERHRRGVAAGGKHSPGNSGGGWAYVGRRQVGQRDGKLAGCETLR